MIIFFETTSRVSWSLLGVQLQTYEHNKTGLKTGQHKNKRGHKRIQSIQQKVFSLSRRNQSPMRSPRGVTAPLLQHIQSLTLPNGYFIQRRRNVSCISEKIHRTLTRAFSSTAATDASHPVLTLYQYQICPYCNIAKALLNYTNTPFQPIEVNPLTKAELKTALLPDKQYKKVPILTSSIILKDEAEDKVPLQQFNGSESIVEYILAIIPVPPGSTSPSTTTNEIDATSPSALQWSDWGRNELAPLLYPNLCNTLANSYQAFGYVHAPNTPFSLLQRYSIQLVGSIAMYLAASKIKKKRNITDERAALMEALEQMHRQLQEEAAAAASEKSKEKNNKLFLSGTGKPHLGDLTIYGVLRGLKGLAVMDTVHQAYPSIQAWNQRMELLVETQHEK